MALEESASRADANLGHADRCVRNVAVARADAGGGLAAGEPALNPDCSVVVRQREVDRHVLEVARDRPARSLDGDHARLDGHGHPLWNVVLLVLDKSLHPHSLATLTRRRAVTTVDR